MSGNSSRPLATHSGWLKLRVDSKEFVTTMTTLCKVEGSRVSEMVQTGRGCIQDAFGVVHIDYNADLFDIILHYLRTGRLILRNNTVEDVLAEADFWHLPGLSELCQAKLHDGNAASSVKDMSIGAANIESPKKESKEDAHAHCAIVTEQRIDSVDPNANVVNPVEYTPPVPHSQPLQQEEPQVADLMKTLAGQSITLRIPPQKESSDTTSEQQPATASEDVNNNRVPRMPVQATRFRQGQALLRPTALQHNIGPVAQKPLTFAGLAASSRDIPMGADRQKADAECKGEAKKGPNDSQNEDKDADDSRNFPAPPNLQPQRTEKLEPPQPRPITATASPLMRQLFRRGGVAGQFKAQVAQQGPVSGNAGGAQQS